MAPKPPPTPVVRDARGRIVSGALNPEGKSGAPVTAAYYRLGRLAPEELERYVPATAFEDIAKGQLRCASGRGYKYPSVMSAAEITDRLEGKVPTANLQVNVEMPPDRAAELLRIAAERLARASVASLTPELPAGKVQ